MQIQDIELTQIIVVLVFLGALVVLQQLIKNNKLGIPGHLNQRKRIKLIDDLALSSSERIRIIRVDNKEYIHFTNKGCSPTVVPHEITNSPKPKNIISTNPQLKKGETDLKNVELNTKKTNLLSDAISNARKMNPKLGFKK